MKIGTYDIQPISMMKTFAIVLPERPERKERLVQHLSEIGMDATLVDGIDAKTFGVLTHNTYDHDHPNEGYIVGYKHVGCALSHYMVWSIALTHSEEKYPDELFLIIEDDAQFSDEYFDNIDQVIEDAGDFDFLSIGNCDCDNKPKELIKGNVYDVRYPLCTHAYIVTRKGIEILLRTQRKIFAPIDLALYFNSYPYMNVKTVLPSLVKQHYQTLNP